MRIEKNWNLDINELSWIVSKNIFDQMQSLMQFDRFLRKAYPENEIGVVIRKYSPLLGGSILEYLMNVNNSAYILIKELEKTAKCKLQP